MTLAKAQRKAKVSLETEVFRFEVEFQRAAARVLGRPVVCRYQWADRLRLLNLRMWTQVYQVSLEYVLQVLVTAYIESKFIKSKRRGNSLGIGIRTLVGQKSRQILTDAIRRDYPGGENLLTLRSQLEESIILSEEVMGRTGEFRIRDPRHFIRAYKARIHRAHALIDELQATLRRRQWRGNPYA